MLISELLLDKPENKICVMLHDDSMTYGQLEKLSNDMAKTLLVKGLSKEDRVLVCEKDFLRQLVCFFAVIKAGGVCVLFPDSASDDERAAFALKQNIKIQIDGSLAILPFKENCPKLSADDIFLGALSSGTTGEAKLILRDHKSWMAAFPEQSRIFNLKNNDVLYLVGSLSYTANLNACMHAFFEGATVAFSKSRMPRTWIKEIKNFGVTALFMVPANYKILLSKINEQIENITSAVSGGAKMDRETAEKLIEVFPQANIVEYYGASELGHITYSDRHDLLTHPDSVGKAFPGVSIKLDNGKIFVESPYIVPSLHPVAIAGDIGHLDDEGYLTLLGRENGIINVAGNKVVLQQVEKTIKKNSRVSDVVVIGIKDGLKGEKVCAFVVKKDETLQTKDLVHFCHENMNRYSCPQKFVFINEIPVNNNGKTDFRLLREMTGEHE